MSFVAGKNLAAVKVYAFDLTGLWQHFGDMGVFRPDGSAEGFYAILRVPTKTLKLNPTTLRLEATGTMYLAEQNADGSPGTILIQNEAQVSVLSTPSGNTNPQFAQVPADIRASGLTVNGDPWSLVSVGGEMQGQIGSVGLFVVHCELEIG